MITVYGISHLFSTEKFYITEYDIQLVNNRNYMFNVYHSLLPVYAIYYYVRKDKLLMNDIFRIVIILLILNTISYWVNYRRQLLEALILGIDRDEFTSNIGYLFLSVVPLLFLMNDRRNIQYAFLMYSLYYILISMKRGAILIGFLSMIYFFIVRLKNSSKRERYIIISLTICIIVLGFYFAQSFYSSSDYFQMRLENSLSGNVSSRQEFYPKLIDYFIYNTTWIQFLLGSGADYTIRIIGNYAHNDWLEIAINNGLLGILVYLSLFVAMFRSYKSQKNAPIYIHNALFIALIIVFMKTLFSMSYANIDPGLSICMGFCFAYKSVNSDKNGRN